MLAKGGHEVIGEGANGIEAVNQYQALRPDIMTLDITMPEKDGLTALKEILNQEPTARVVMCSALGQESKVLEAIKAGAKDFVVKPFQPDRVLDAIGKALVLTKCSKTQARSDDYPALTASDPCGTDALHLQTRADPRPARAGRAAGPRGSSHASCAVSAIARPELDAATRRVDDARGTGDAGAGRDGHRPRPARVQAYMERVERERDAAAHGARGAGRRGRRRPRRGWRGRRSSARRSTG